jgi:hypothetical protein
MGRGTSTRRKKVVAQVLDPLSYRDFAPSKKLAIVLREQVADNGQWAKRLSWQMGMRKPSQQGYI